MASGGLGGREGGDINQGNNTHPIALEPMENSEKTQESKNGTSPKYIPDVYFQLPRKGKAKWSEASPSFPKIFKMKMNPLQYINHESGLQNLLSLIFSTK